MSRWILVATVLVAGAIATGCKLGGGLQIEPVSVSAKPPSNVVMYVSVSRDGEQVPTLNADNFHVTEDGTVLDNREIHLAILPRDLQAVHEAVLLIDMSRTLGPIERASLVKNLRGFISKLRHRQNVVLYAYDGAEAAHFISRYERDLRAEAAKGDPSLERLMDFNRQDSSTSLYSALLFAAGELAKAHDKSSKPTTVGSFIIIAQGPDLAGRVPEQQAWDFVNDSPHQFYLVTVGGGTAGADLGWLGRDGVEAAVTFGVLGAALGRLAQRIEDDYSQYYLVGYCSPARSGQRAVTLSVESTDEQGQKIIGYYDTEIDATHFGPGCDPSNLAPPAASPPPPPAEEKKSVEPAKPKRPSRKPPRRKPKIVSPPPGLGYE